MAEPTPAEALQMSPPTEAEGCFHAWTLVDDCETYADPSTPGARGCFYVRFPTPEGPGDFDCLFELDFPSLSAAEEFAGQYEARHGIACRLY